MVMKLLSGDDPSPVDAVPPTARRPRGLIIADHAGRCIPAALAGLGLPDAERDRHIGWDIGIEGVARNLAALLGAGALVQRLLELENYRTFALLGLPKAQELAPSINRIERRLSEVTEELRGT